MGVEVVGMGIFLLFTFAQELRSGMGLQWNDGIVGGTLVLVGLEMLHLIRSLPGAKTSEARWR